MRFRKYIRQFSFFLCCSQALLSQDVVFVPKQVVLIGIGLPGVGKTTLFKQLAKRVSNCVYLNKDLVNDALLGQEEYFSDYYNKYVRHQGYEVILNLAYANLGETPRLIILDAQLGDKLSYPCIKRLLDDPTIEKKIVYFHCSYETNKQRLIQRGASRNVDQLKCFDDHYYNTTQLYLNQLSSYEYLTIDMDQDLLENIEKVMHHLLG